MVLIWFLVVQEMRWENFKKKMAIALCGLMGLPQLNKSGVENLGLVLDSECGGKRIIVCKYCIRVSDWHLWCASLFYTV